MVTFDSLHRMILSFSIHLHLLCKYQLNLSFVLPGKLDDQSYFLILFRILSHYQKRLNAILLIFSSLNSVLALEA
jgi:hypothetical protein